ncbi:MAG: TetR/AcrR family transcriptional regulator [Fidelibacterota bacterium]|nr:MAG: TetR/AcrR family transcriptional regulator [Candidatus Neomarinimicrobiota bacterium]
MTPRPKNSTKEKTEETRLRILEAAEAAFAAKGFEGANMREIAQTAGVNKFMLYYHFDNKETLFTTVLQSNLQPAFQQLGAILSQPVPLEEALTQVYDLYAGLFEQKGERLRAFMAREIAAGAPHVKPVFASIAPQILALWEPKIARFLRQDRLPERLLRQLVASIMIGVVANFLMQPLFAEIMLASGISLYDEDMKQHVVRFILGGVHNSMIEPANNNTKTEGAN